MQTEVGASIDRNQRKEVFIPKSASNNQLNSKLQKLNKLSEPTCKLVNTNENHIYGVFISCIEIYNNYIYDLLDEFDTFSSDGGQK
jgi:kinesin family member 23